MAVLLLASACAHFVYKTCKAYNSRTSSWFCLMYIRVLLTSTSSINLSRQIHKKCVWNCSPSSVPLQEATSHCPAYNSIKTHSIPWSICSISLRYILNSSIKKCPCWKTCGPALTHTQCRDDISNTLWHLLLSTCASTIYNYGKGQGSLSRPPLCDRMDALCPHNDGNHALYQLEMSDNRASTFCTLKHGWGLALELWETMHGWKESHCEWQRDCCEFIYSALQSWLISTLCTQAVINRLCFTYNSKWLDLDRTIQYANTTGWLRYTMCFDWVISWAVWSSFC